MNLTPHFLLSDLTVTNTGLPNTPPPDAVACLRALCSAVLEPWRERVGPIAVTSGYRSAAVNKAVGGATSSQHLRGEAADVRPGRTPIAEAWHALVKMTEAGLPVDQAIVYVRAPGRGWIHVSHTARTVARREFLVEAGGRYVPFREWTGALVLPPSP